MLAFVSMMHSITESEGSVSEDRRRGVRSFGLESKVCVCGGGVCTQSDSLNRGVSVAHLPTLEWVVGSRLVGPVQSPCPEPDPLTSSIRLRGISSLPSQPISRLLLLVQSGVTVTKR